MPAHSIRPAPTTRMRELLEQAIRTGYVGPVPLLRGGARTPLGFEDAWQAAWRLMISERAYPHRTEERAQWREALRATKPEFCASYCRIETGYSRFHALLLAALEADDRSRPVGGDGVLMVELVA
jgi:hypothetical protein